MSIFFYLYLYLGLPFLGDWLHFRNFGTFSLTWPATFSFTKIDRVFGHTAWPRSSVAAHLLGAWVNRCMQRAAIVYPPFFLLRDQSSRFLSGELPNFWPRNYPHRIAALNRHFLHPEVHHERATRFVGRFTILAFICSPSIHRAVALQPSVRCLWTQFSNPQAGPVRDIWKPVRPCKV